MRRVTIGDCARAAVFLAALLLFRELLAAVDRDAACAGAARYVTTCEPTGERSDGR